MPLAASKWIIEIGDAILLVTPGNVPNWGKWEKNNTKKTAKVKTRKQLKVDVKFPKNKHPVAVEPKADLYLLTASLL